MSFCHCLHAAMPLLGSNTTKCFHASATGHEDESATCPGLARECSPKDGPHPPAQAVRTCKVVRPHIADTLPSHDPHNILMIPQLGQRLHLPRYGSSVSLEQKRIGGSLGSDSKASSQEPSPQPISLGQILPHVRPVAVLRPQAGPEDLLISEEQD